jgi:hypothetical protein
MDSLFFPLLEVTHIPIFLSMLKLPQPLASGVPSSQLWCPVTLSLTISDMLLFFWHNACFHLWFFLSLAATESLKPQVLLLGVAYGSQHLTLPL